MARIINTTFGLLNYSIKSSDEDMLELCKFYQARGVLEDNE